MVDQTVTTVTLLGKSPTASYTHLPFHVRGQAVLQMLCTATDGNKQEFTADLTTEKSPGHPAFSMPLTGEFSATRG